MNAIMDPMGRVSSGVLIGREAELDALNEAMDSARAGRPRALVISGEAGVGKTRLLREMSKRAQGAGTGTVVGGCIPMSQGALPYAPVIAALRQLVRMAEAPVAALPLTTKQELGRLLPELRIPEDGKGTDTDQARLFDAILALLRAQTTTAPLIFAIEDVHWSDASTRDLVTYLLNMVEDERILFLCSLRTGELEPSHPVPTWIQNLAGSRMADIIELQPLSRDETRRQMSEIAGYKVGDSVVAEVFERSEGNPFFVEELVQAVTRGAEDLPPSLRELLLSRIRALSAEAIEIVKAISVDGPVVSHELLVAATGVAEKDITPLLQGAIDRHLLVRTEDDGYTFRHALMRETVYGRILPGERRTLHRSFAQALERLNGGPIGASPHSGRLARHWQEAGDHRRALGHALAAATDAERSYASSEALQHYNHALIMWDQVENPEEAAGIAKVALLERAAEAAQRTMHPEQAAALYEKAIGLVDPATDPGRAATLRSSLAYVMGGHLLDDEAAEPLLREAQALVEDLPPTIEKAQVLGNLADDLNIAGQMEEGFAMAEKAVAIAREVGDVAQECRALNTLGLAYDLKDPDTALGYLTAALKLARELRDGQLLGRISANLSDALYRASRTEDAVTFALAAIDELAEMGDDSFEGFLRCNAAEFLISLGRWDEAETIVDPLQRASSLLDRVFSGWVLTEIDVARGRFEQAHTRIATLKRNMSHMKDPQHQDPITLAKVSLALWERRYDDASALVQDVWASFKQDERSIARLCILGLRVEADRAARARAGGSDDVERQAVQRGAVLENRCAAVVTGSKVPEVNALGQLAAAEASRLRARAEPELWKKAVQTSDELTYRYQAAYARYRYGESLLARGERVEAGRVLSEAREATGEMGAVPLRLEIEGLGRRARLTLSAEAGPDQQADVVTLVPAEGLGLTRREIEVLRSLSEGLTNKQIAEALFISPKTASIHVSSILAKLGVSSRTEAARRAYDSGLLDHSGAG